MGILRLGAVKILDISQLYQLSEVDLMVTFGEQAKLETLYLLEMPQISLQTVASLWHQPTSVIKDIHHTELYRRPFTEKYIYSSLKSMLQSPLVTAHMRPIKTILWARILVDIDDPTDVRKADGINVDWQRSVPANGSQERDIMRCGVYPLDDTFLSLTKLVMGLMNFFCCAAKGLEHCPSGGLMDTGFTLAKSFAMAPPRLVEEGGPDPVTTMGPLPASMFAAASLSAKQSNLRWTIDFPPLKQDEGAIVIVNEHDEFKRLHQEDLEKSRSAVVFRTSNAEYNVQSMEDYLHNAIAAAAKEDNRNTEAASLLAQWKQRMSFVGFCGSEDVHNLLPAMHKTIDWMREGLEWRRICHTWDD